MSENSMGFHAPQEATRVLAEAINFCRLGQLSLRTTVSPAQQAPLQKANLQSAPGQGK
jgi:nitrite reductase (cytochrome c-552)